MWGGPWEAGRVTLLKAFTFSAKHLCFLLNARKIPSKTPSPGVDRGEVERMILRMCLGEACGKNSRGSQPRGQRLPLVQGCWDCSALAGITTLQAGATQLKGWPSAKKRGD